MKSLLTSNCPSCIIVNSMIDGSLKYLFPEVYNLINIPQGTVFHPECDSLVHTILAVQYAANSKYSSVVRLGTFLHDIGKYITYCEKQNLHGHEKEGEALIDHIFHRDHTLNWIKSEINEEIEIETLKEFCKYITLRHCVLANYTEISIKKIVKEVLYIHNIFGNNSFKIISYCIDVIDSDKNGRLQKIYDKESLLYFWSTAYHDLEKVGFQELNSQEYHKIRLSIINELVNSLKV